MNGLLEIRPASESEYSSLEYFLRYEYFVHQHLDWRPVLDWLGIQPFYVALHAGDIIGCLAAPNEVDKVAWIRLFACSSHYSRIEIWKKLYEKVLIFFQHKVNEIAVLGIQPWLTNLLLEQNFKTNQHIIVFEWNRHFITSEITVPDLLIQPLTSADIQQVSLVDKICFSPRWQLSEYSIDLALKQSGYATIAIFEGKMIGYQICTESYSSAHLARLAIDPNFRGKNFAKALLIDLLSHYLNIGISKVTLNTQDDNLSSQALYTKMGFTKTDEKYPVLINQI